MGKTATDICNMALARIGVSQFLLDYSNDQSNEAKVCRIFYDNVRDRVIQELPWNFATRTATLTDIGTPPSRWAYRYRYPVDCITARKVTVSGAPSSIESAEFEVVEDEAAGSLAICTNQQSAVLIYTAKITNTILFSQAFIDTFAWALATEIAAPLSAEPKMATAAGNAYTVALLRAAGRHLNEGKEARPTTESGFITARR